MNLSPVRVCSQFLLILLPCLLFLFGCASAPKENVINTNKPISELTPSDRIRLFPEEIKTSDFKLGLALSGGGMRSASFSIGILAGLSDRGVLSHVDHISTVSGGGYAGYWYLNTLHYLQSKNIALEPKQLFNDCYPSRLEEKQGWDLYRHTDNHLYNEDCTHPDQRVQERYRFQNQIAQQSDLLNYYQDGGLSFFNNFTDNVRQTGEFVAILIAQTLSIPAHHLANTLFDWNWHISPVKWAYNKGIERTFGLVPIDLKKPHIDRKAYYNRDGFLWMDNFGAKDLPFSALALTTMASRKACGAGDYAKGVCIRMPIWVVNAASNYARSICRYGYGTSATGKIFEFTPYSYGSENNGYVQKAFEQLSVSETVQLSGAAMDSQYNPLSNTWQSAGLHVANLNLGEKIDNYHPDSPNVSLRAWLPIPFYCFPITANPKQANSIYLSDGAHAEHTGAYALIRRGIKNIIMVDASEDVKGAWMEVKKLASILKKEHGLNFELLGKENLLLDALDNPIAEEVVKPQEAKEHIFVGEITGFAPGYISQHENENKINIYFVKTGLIKKYLAENCGNNKAYPCSVSRYFQNRHVKQGDDCVPTDEFLFPNNSTISTSFNMSVDIYFAYRDLARHIAKRIHLDGNNNIKIEPLAEHTGDLKKLNCSLTRYKDYKAFLKQN